MTTTTVYGIQRDRPGYEPQVYSWASLAAANEVQQDWSTRTDQSDGATYTVVSRTITVTDWAPVDPIEARS